MKNNNMKKFLSLALAFSMGAPVATMADGVKSENEDNEENYGYYTLVSQEEHNYHMTIEEYAYGVNNAINYLKNYINYDHLPQDMQCLYFLTNIDYISAELRDELISKGIIYDANLDSEEGLKNFMNAFNLINMIADYNQSMIRDEKHNSPESIIDVSKLCFDLHDAELVNNMHNNYFIAYKDGKYSSEYFTKIFKQLTTLNAYEKEGNAYELSTGARWLAQNSIGGGVMQLLRDDMQERFSKEELYQFFKREELNRAQWFMRDDLEFDLNCLSDKELEVFMFGQLWQFVYTDVNKDIFKYFEVNGKKYCK